MRHREVPSAPTRTCMTTTEIHDTRRDESSGTVAFYLPATSVLSAKRGRLERFVRSLNKGLRP